MIRPKQNEYNSYYAGYIKNIPDDVLQALKDQLLSTKAFLENIPEDKADFSYAKGKWSIKEVVGHLIDAERIFSYRALAISRGEVQPLPAWNEKLYTGNGNFNNRTLFDLADELLHLRQANLLHFKNFNEDILDRRGVANNSEVTVRAILFIIAGHQLHHLGILKDRYLEAKI